MKKIIRDNPDEEGLTRWLAGVESALGNLRESQRLGDTIIDEGLQDASYFNNHAWLALFTGKVRDRDLNEALKSVQVTGGKSASSLHTLATLYAEMGRAADARRVLGDLLALRQGGLPLDVDYYIVGRIAESLSLDDVARDAYRRVERPEQDSRTSTYRLAQTRLGKLEAGRGNH
jgi:hypothetical protein